MPTLTPQQSQQFQSQINQIQAGINDIRKNGETPSTSGFKINVPDRIPSNVLGTNVTKNDVFSSRDALQRAFETYQSQSSGLQSQITAALAPSEAESTAEKSLLEKTQGYRQGLANIENKPIAMEFITGQSAALQKQASLDLLASSEALQSLTNKRKGVLESLTTQLGFQKQNFEDILGISKEFRSIAKDEKDSARQDMQDIVSFAQGKTFEQLDPETQSKLTQVAANSGLTLDIIKQGLSNAKIAFDEDRRKSALEERKLLSEINKVTDVSSGLLTDADVKRIDGSPQGKKLIVLSDLNKKLSDYQTLVNTYGFKVSGSSKALLDQAYADLKIAYKEAANLGALTGPDIAVLEEAIKPASGGLGKAAKFKLSGGQSGVANAIGSSLQKAKQSALLNYKQLTLRNPSYAQSEYVRSLIDPFAMDLTTMGDSEEALNAIPLGEIIRTPDGIYLESLGNGQFSEL